MNQQGERSSNTSQHGDLEAQFAEQGFIGPLKIFAPDECRRVLELTRRSPQPAVWFKGNAASSWPFHALATRDDILRRVALLLGDDVMLWGASLIGKRPGEAHQWHTDLETSDPTSRTVTVWIGLDNTNRHSSLQLISHSHLFGVSVQQVTCEAGKRRDQVTTQDVLRWAQERDPRSRVTQLDMRDGDALMFDGRIWHGSRNTNPRGVRTALLLQYATPDTLIRIPDLEGHYDWPFQFLSRRRAPCIMVRGTDRHGVNSMVETPDSQRTMAPANDTFDTDTIWPCWIRTLEQPPEEDKRTGWRIEPVFGGSTFSMQPLRSHFSVLSSGTTPHPPHTHREEELIVVLSGEVDIVTVTDTSEQMATTTRIGPGSIVYHSAEQRHTIRSVGPGAATYLVFKWQGQSGQNNGSRLQSSIFDARDTAMASRSALAEGFTCAPVFDSPTLYLRKLHCHVSTLEPGAGYDPHRDAYDVVVVVLSGDVETLGRRVGPNGVIFYPAGELHGMRNTGADHATYLVFEFHGDPDQQPDHSEAWQEEERWRERCDSFARELATLVSNQTKFIFVDDGRLHAHGPFREYQGLPFLERDGRYWGPPDGDETAIRELERMRIAGTRFVVVAWPAFWWLEHYAGFRHYLRSNFACVRDEGNMVAFDLQKLPR